MPRGRRTSYTRDNSGRFASSPGGGAPKRSTPATRRAATRAGNRLNRDNSGRISGIGRNGATVRGGRLKTAKGNKRATQLASMRPAVPRAGTIAKGGRGVRGMVARSLAAARKGRMAAAAGLSRARPGQQQRALQRAQANEKRLQGPAARGTSTRTRAGVGYAVAKGAQGYYSGSTPRRKATFSPLTGSMDKKALAARRKQAVDNNKPQKGKAAKPAVAAKDSAKPAKKESKRNISDAKAGRIIARLDANRPGLRKATGSDRRNRNLLQTYDRASKFVLAASTRESKRTGGQGRMDLAESVRRAVRNAKAKAKPKPKPAILGRVPTKGPGRGPLMKARATPAKPSPKSPRIRARIEGSARPAGTVAKPRGMKPGVLARRRGVKPFKKVDTSQSGVKARRQRALAPKNSTYLSQKMESRSAIVRSAANAIYNRQRTTGKVLGLAPVVVRQPIGIMPGLSGSNRNRAMANLENARTRVIKGRKGRR